MCLEISDCILHILDFTSLGAGLCYMHLNIVGLHPGVAVKLLEISLIPLKPVYKLS